MTSFQIKLIAIITMFIDHFGAFFYPEEFFYRAVGRLSFILFTWLIANGAHHTKDIQRYLKRLVIFALISQIPFSLMTYHFSGTYWGLNVLFTLAMGLSAILLVQRVKNRVAHLLIILSTVLLAEFLGADYGAAGVLSVIAFYYFYHNLKLSFLAQAVIFFSFYTIPEYALLAQTDGSVGINLIALFQPLCLLSFIFIGNYNHQEGRKMKYFFYAFYPLHILFLYAMTFVVR